MSLYRSYLFDKILKRAEFNFEEEYKENRRYADLNSSIDNAIRFYWDELLRAIEYRQYDEDTLYNKMYNDIYEEIDEDSIVDNLTCGSYWGMSPRERNPFLF